MSHTPYILLVDDDPDLRRLVTLRLQTAGHQVVAVEHAEAALAQMALSLPQLLISDIRLPGMDGMQLFEQVRASHPGLPVILLTAHGSIPDAVDAAQRGVFDYLSKPFDGKLLLQKVAAAMNMLPTPAAGDDESWRSGILSRSAVMQTLLAEARLLAQSDASVLIQGESGSGKELLAQAVHRASPRRTAPFIAVNCGAIPESLLESELFGHVKGAYSGASSSREGLFYYARGGTLFLDEIGELPLAAQAKLLRALEERRVRPVGSEQEIPVNARVVAATNRDLAQEVAAGRFRQDLYYRLQVMEIELPALRERPEDIPELINHFTRQLAGQLGVPPVHPDAASLRRLQGYDWPGNVRELRNLVERSLIFGYYDLKPEPASAAAEAGAALPAQPEVLLEAVEKRHILAVLNACGGNKSEAARQLGVSRKTLDRKCNAWGV